MKSYLQFLIWLMTINFIFSFRFCTKTNEAPEELAIDNTKIINPVSYSGKEYQPINIGNQIFLDKNTANYIYYGTTTIYSDSRFCPDDFKIPTQSDYESLIKNLGPAAYSVFISQEGFNMEAGKYYLTNTIPKEISGETQFYKMFLYLDGNSLKFIKRDPFASNNAVRCMLDPSKFKFILSVENRDLELNEKVTIKTTRDGYMNGFLWKIEDNIMKTENIEYQFTKSGGNKVEFWGKYINGSYTYLCDYIYVNKKSISNSQSFDESKIKNIVTDFQVSYANTLHFVHSNFPIAPRDNGGYYIAFTDKNYFLHVLSYDKNDILLKDFNTTEKAYPHDITVTDYGFAIYMREAGSNFHSYINLYNKDFELINVVQIMNNNPTDDRTKDSNLEKQLIKYDSSGSPVFGMRFMYDPDNGKLIYSRGRIFLIFCHYNHFLNNGGHTGDTIATFNDILLDIDYGETWGASHSLIQSATFDPYYFWTAALSDAYPEGIRVQFTSKKDLTNDYDPINKKYNSLVTGSNTTLAGYIKGYHTGPADGKLGGMLYFESYKLYCLVYAKTPNYSDDSTKNNKNIIFITTWNFENNQIKNSSKTYEIKVFNEGNVMQLRAGKYGNDKIIIIYAETSNQGNNGYGNVAKGTVPRVFVIKIPDINIQINDVTYDKLLMNTNEDLRTFRDGVLIWGAANKDGNLVINKIGKSSLDDSYEDVNYKITKKEVEDIKNKIKEEEEKDEQEVAEDNHDSSLSAGAIAAIVISIIIILTVGTFLLVRYIKKRDNGFYKNISLLKY